ncbi:MAG: hypothetical protein IJJ20_07825 [Thermoguttaceae bacterium]|nr:hypothetical protein [Thermoguttaceae bacterium]
MCYKKRAGGARFDVRENRRQIQDGPFRKKTAKSRKPRARREFRDRLFKFIFGNPEHKDWTLQLYNAINGSHHTNPDDIQLNTIKEILYMGMKNDVSFLIDDTLSFYEQQSTVNPNMPMRYFIYAAMVYEKYIRNTKFLLYSSETQKAPTPKCVCFYNGTDETKDRTVLKLSDAFAEGSKPDIEVRVTMININYGRNKKLLDACKPLKEYSWFGDTVRTNQETKTLEEAIDAALKDMPDDFVIKPFLMDNKAEVKHMILTEYDEEKILKELAEEQKEIGRAEGRAEGEARGIEIGTFRTLAELVSDGTITLAKAAQKAGMTAAEFKKRVARLKKERAEA